MTPPNPNWPPGNKPTKEKFKLSVEQRAMIERAIEIGPKRLDMSDPYFDKLIPKNDRDRHLREVRRNEEMFASDWEKNGVEGEDEMSLLSEGLEAALTARINEGYLGEEWKAQRTTKYDDQKKRVDVYIENVQNPEPVGLQVDITFSEDIKNLSGKLTDIKDLLLDGGRFVGLEYYKPIGTSDTPPAVRPSIKVPRVLVGTTRERALKTVERFAKGEVVQDDAVIGLFMINQIKIQLEHFVSYCTETGNALLRASHVTDRGKGRQILDSVPVYQRALDIQNDLLQKKLQQLGIANLPKERIEVLLETDIFSSNLKKALKAVLPITQNKMAA